MSKPFTELREQLLRAGVAPRHARRYLKERIILATCAPKRNAPDAVEWRLRPPQWPV